MSTAPVEIVERDGGRYCFDCPDIDGPRPRCCRDEHTDRRLAGDPREFEGIEVAREISDREAAAGITPSRQVRRRRARKGHA